MTRMNKITVLFLLLIFGGELSARETADTLTVKRKIFTSGVYLKGTRMNNQRLLDLYSKAGSFNAERQLRQSRIMLPVGAAVSVAGLALSVKTIAGEKMTAVINNQEYTYYKRPVAHLLGGIGMVAAGICIMEFGNDKKGLSVDLYNKKKKNDSLQPSVGLNEQGHPGIKLSF